jgi:hypothetical protein
MEEIRLSVKGFERISELYELMEELKLMEETPKIQMDGGNPVGLMKFDRMILSGIALGHDTPLKLSQHINVDREDIKREIEVLTGGGYVKDPDDPIVGVLNFFRLGRLIDLIEWFTTRKLTHRLVLTNIGYDSIDEETMNNIDARLRSEGIIERIVGWLLSWIVGILRPILNIILAALGLLSLVMTVIGELPSIIIWVVKLWLSDVIRFGRSEHE